MSVRGSRAEQGVARSVGFTSRLCLVPDGVTLSKSSPHFEPLFIPWKMGMITPTLADLRWNQLKSCPEAHLPQSELSDNYLPAACPLPRDGGIRLRPRRSVEGMVWRLVPCREDFMMQLALTFVLLVLYLHRWVSSGFFVFVP